MLTGNYIEMFEVLGISLGYLILIVLFLTIAVGSFIAAGPFNQNAMDAVKEEEIERLALILKTKLIYSPRLSNPKRWIQHRCSKHCKNTSLESKFTSHDIDTIVMKARVLVHDYRRTVGRLKEEGKLI